MRSNDETMALTVGEATMHDWQEAMMLLKSAPPMTYTGSQKIWPDETHPPVRRPRAPMPRTASTGRNLSRPTSSLRAGARPIYWLLLLGSVTLVALQVGLSA
jgi:hypothetical protein